MLLMKIMKWWEGRDLKCVKCFKDEGQTMLVKEEEIEERLKSYFNKHFNGSLTKKMDRIR